MKRILALILALLLLTGCGAAQSATPTTTATAEATEPQPTAEASNAGILAGKKIIFIGNSYTQAANVVIDYGYSKLTQQERVYDQGYFYQLCKANGVDSVNVTSWCFGGHNITDTFSDACPTSKSCSGENHPAYLEDPYYDYVAIQCYKEPLYQGDLKAYLEPVFDFFRQANPNVKFILLVPHMAVEKNYPWVDQLDIMQEEGVLICNWGAMLHDIVKGNVEVPGAQQPYGRPTFVISVSQEDGHHQNILAGYLTALMVYCAITGDTAVGQTYDFCADSKVNSKFMDFETYKSKRYTYEPYTNFDLVFQSEADMAGLQQLVDQYIAKFN